MVLLVRVVDPPVDPTQTLVLKNDRGMYKVGLDGKQAVFFPAELKDAPTTREQPRLHEKGRGNVYSTPCGGLIDEGAADGSPARAASDETFQALLSKVHSSVIDRNNVTIINRGSPATNKGVFYQDLVNAVVNTISGTAERALQIVADEIAKEKQMQRLLQSEEDSSQNQMQLQGPKPPAPRADGNSPKRQALALSRTLMQRINALGESRGFSPQKGGSLRLTGTATSRSAVMTPRFTLLAGSYDDALVPPSVEVPLTPKALTARPPPRVDDPAKDSASRSTTKRPTASQKQKSSKDLLAKVAANAGDGSEQTVIRNNGWESDLKHYHFNGVGSVMMLPGIPRLEEVVKSFTIDFWLKSDCRISDGKRILAQMMEGTRPEVGMLFSIGLNWHNEYEESVRLYIRDAGNRAMECLIPIPNVLGTNEFHHIVIRMKSIDDGKVEAFVDSERIDRVKYLQQEHPTQFNVWRHRLSIGGAVDDGGHVVSSLRGSICEFRVWRSDKKSPVVRWPLVGDPNAAGRVVEATHTIDEDQKQELIDVRQTVEPKPLVCPLFDENLVVNLGTMGLLGELLDSWSVEIQFKTGVTNRSMSLLGITDGQQKMSEFGIVLNAEPVLSKDKYRYHEFHTTFYLVDCWGQTCSALLRGSDRQSLVDDNWHTLSWRIVDSESNRFEVKVDGVLQDLLLVYRDGPKNFCSFRDWVCLGGHNVRGWKIKNMFQGRIKGCTFGIAQEPFTSLPMNEGPGANVLVDISGHRNHGLLIHPAGKEPRRNDMQWSPCAIAHKTHEEGIPELAPNVVIHKNNKVAFAALQFGPQFDKDGVISDVILDVTTGKPVELVQSAPDGLWGIWHELPEGAFHNVETCAQLKDSVHTLVKNRDPRSSDYFLLVIKVGDCAVSLLDVAGPYVPANATFDVNMMKWKYALAIAGSKGRRTQHLNAMMHGLDKLLLELSATPQFVMRLGPQNLKNKRVTCEQMIASLSSCGIPWRLPTVLHGLILRAYGQTTTHCIHSVMRTVNEEEATSVAVLHKAIQSAAQDAATIMIQRNWRCHMAKRRVVTLEEERQVRKHRVEEIMALRRTNPLVQAKKALRAIVITCHEFSSDVIQPITSNNPNDLLEALRAQGYAVEHVRNPSRSQLIKAISSVEADSSTFVYISAYGGPLRIRELPPFAIYFLHFTITESSSREDVTLEHGRRLRAIINDFYVELHNILQAKNAKAKKAAGKPANQAQIAQQQRQVEETFRVLKEELTKEESEARAKFLMRDYESQCALIAAEMRSVLLATAEFESFYRSKANQAAYVVPSDCKRVEMFPDDVFNVEDVLSRVLHKQLPPMGLQCVVAVDLVGLTPLLPGSAYLACSTGHSITFQYSPQQRHVLSWYVTKAFQGAAPRVPLKSKDHILQGAVDTSDSQRDWRSFASYVCNKVQIACASTVPSRYVSESLSKELPYVADVIPMRCIPQDAEAVERAHRDRESKRVNCGCVFAVDTSRISGDMSAEFRSFLQYVTINEVAPPVMLGIIFLNANSGIDGIRMDYLRAELEKCVTGDLKFSVSLSNNGALVHFTNATPADKARLQQSINLISSRSISWRFPTAPFSSRQFVEVERVEAYFTAKAQGTQQKFRQLQKQRNEAPLPFPTVRFVECFVE